MRGTRATLSIVFAVLGGLVAAGIVRIICIRAGGESPTGCYSPWFVGSLPFWQGMLAWVTGGVLSGVLLAQIVWYVGRFIGWSVRSLFR
jgi:hypothetical protein